MGVLYFTSFKRGIDFDSIIQGICSEEQSLTLLIRLAELVYQARKIDIFSSE